MERLVLAALWLTKRPLTSVEILAGVEAAFSVTVAAERIHACLEGLLASGTIIGDSETDGATSYRVSEHRLQQLQDEIARGEALEAAVRDRLLAIARTTCPGIGAGRLAQLWEEVTTHFLLPIVAESGARTYDLIAGRFGDVDRTVTLQQFLGRFPVESRDAVRLTVAQWLDPSDAGIRAYLLRHMNAFFVVEASGLSSDSIRGIARHIGARPTFVAFVDTNVVFSLLGLHSEPANDAARRMADLVGTVAGAADVSLRILPPTIDEVRAALDAEAGRLGTHCWTPNVARAALKSETLGDVGVHFARAAVGSPHGLMPADYFEPFITNPVGALRACGVELFNASFEHYEHSAAVESDVNQVIAAQERERRRTERAGRTVRRLKGRAQVQHDVMLWHYVRDKRPPSTDSPLDAAFWLLTEDYGAIGFDQAKAAGQGRRVPVCVHPVVLVQMLQFWVGRTPELEAALVGSLRFTCLFQEFDAAAERVTLRILQQLALYEDVHDLPVDVITATLLNRGIRQRVAASRDERDEGRAVRDALIEQTARLTKAANEMAAERDAANARTQSATTTYLAELEAERANGAVLAAEVEELRVALQASESREREREARDREQAAETASHTVRRSRLRRFSFHLASAAALAVASAAGICRVSYIVRGSLPVWWPVSAGTGIVVVTALWLRWGVWRGERDQYVRDWRPFIRFRRASVWIIGVLLVGVGIGVLANFVTEALGHSPDHVAHAGGSRPTQSTSPGTH